MKLLKALLAIMIFAIVAGGVAAGAGWVWLQNEIVRTGPLDGEPQTLLVARGEGLAVIAPRLEASGVVRDARVMRLAARLRGVDSRIKAGEYQITPGESVAALLDRLVSGEVILHRITIPEGLTTAQIFKRIEADPVLEGEMPNTVPEEGTLLPDTYTFSRGMTRAELVELMQREQAELLAELWAGRDPSVPVASPREALILASVVQKEAAGQDEYEIVASVFVNRLRRGMRLEADATAHYGVNRGEPLYNRSGQRRTLLRSEVDTPTPWNTYAIDGLPATPICNPGRGAIAAVMQPATTDYIFFVADGTGGHAFAVTLREHNENVAAYRRFEREEIARERGQ